MKIYKGNELIASTAKPDTKPVYVDVLVEKLEKLNWTPHATREYAWVNEPIPIPNPPEGKTCVSVSTKGRGGFGVADVWRFDETEFVLYAPSKQPPDGFQIFRFLYI